MARLNRLVPPKPPKKSKTAKAAAEPEGTAAAGAGDGAGDGTGDGAGDGAEDEAAEKPIDTGRDSAQWRQQFWSRMARQEPHPGDTRQPEYPPQPGVWVVADPADSTGAGVPRPPEGGGRGMVSAGAPAVARPSRASLLRQQVASHGR
jgi:hypothetical protein